MTFTVFLLIFGYIVSLGIAALLATMFNRRQSESAPVNKLMQIAEWSTGVVLLDDQERIADINPAARAILQASGERLAGENVERLFVNRPALQAAYHNGINGRQEISLRVNNEICSYDFELLAMQDENGLENGRALTFINITERKQTEARLRQLSRAVEQSGSGIIITNLDGDIEFINPAFSRITGYTAEEVIGRNPRILKSNKNDPALYTDMWDTLKNGNIWKGELINKKKKGDLYWEAATISPVKDRQGVTTHYLSIKENITEQKQKQKALEENEQHLRRLTDSVSDIILETNADGIIEYVTPSWEIELGYKPEQALRTPLIDYLHPEDIAGVKDIFIKKRKMTVSEVRCRHIKGHYLYFNVKSAFLFDEQNRITGAVVGATNITQRKKAQKELQIAYKNLETRYSELKTLNAIIQSLDRANNLNDALQQVTYMMTMLLNTFQCGISLLSENNSALIVTAQYSTKKEQDSAVGIAIPLKDNIPSQRIIKTGKSIYIPRVQLNREIGEFTRNLMRDQGIFSILLVPLTAHGEVIGIIGIDIDKPDREFTDNEIRLAETVAAQIASSIANARLLDARQQAVREAKAANKAKSSFLANMSHELRTPLNAILGFAQLMQRDPDLTIQQREHLKIIGNSGEHLLELINDVLEMSKIEAGRMTLNPSDFDLHQLLDDVVSMLTIKAAEKGIEMRTHYAINLPRYINADEGKLRQILINLLGNAVKFTQSGSIILRARYRIDETLSLAQLPTNRLGQAFAYSLTFEIEDTGPGIALPDLETVFNPFVQTKRGGGQQGTGLGLPISRHFAQMMGGNMRVRSKAGIGSVFLFDIQAKPADAGDVDVAEKRHAIGLVDGQPSWRILLAEDNEASRKLLVKFLEPMGFETRGAENGRVAINHALRWKPHLIFMDIQMPVMDGLEATKEIRALFPELPIIALTAGAFAHNQQAAIEAGCTDFIAKPVDATIMFQKIARYLGAEFIYEEEEDTTAAETAVFSPLSPHQIAALPTRLQQQLHHAASIADRNAVGKIITLIREEHEEVANALENLLHNFQFDQIITLTENQARKA